MTGFWRAGVKTLIGLQGSGAGDTSSDRILTIGFDDANVSNGDRVARILVSYYLQTSLNDNVTTTDLLPRPWAVCAWYRPDPEADPGAFDEVIPALNSDALYSDMARWTPTRWTDGTIHSTQWYAHSDGVVSCQGNRTIEDKTTAVLRIGVDLIDDEFGTTAVAVNGRLYMKVLIERRFG